MNELSDDELLTLRALASLSEERRARLFEIASMPEEDWQELRRYPRYTTAVRTTIMVLTGIAGAVWALISLAPDRAADAAKAALAPHGP